MHGESPDSLRELLELQGGVVARWQAPAAGLSPEVIKSRLRSGRWRPMYRGVYACFTGVPCRQAWLWAAVLRAGPDAVLSHQTAAELDKLLDKPATLIYVTVPGEQHVGQIPGVRVYRSRRMAVVRHPSRLPPRTRIEETVLDLTQTARTLEVALGWLYQACGSRLTTPERLRASMAGRRQMRWRQEMQSSLSDISDGMHSALEVRYVRDVEQPHGLPRARRQVAVLRGTRRVYLDNLLEEYQVCVELDGQAAHPAAARWRDIQRDNSSASAGLATLRYGWWDISQQPCQTAAQIVTVLRQRGWTGVPRQCRPGCPVGKP